MIFYPINVFKDRVFFSPSSHGKFSIYFKQTKEKMFGHFGKQKVLKKAYQNKLINNVVSWLKS